MADRTIMNAKDAVSASLAECFVTIGDNRYNFMQAINLEANFEKNKTEVPILGKTGKGNKATGWKGTGSATFHYNTSIFRISIHAPLAGCDSKSAQKNAALLRKRYKYKFFVCKKCTSGDFTGAYSSKNTLYSGANCSENPCALSVRTHRISGPSTSNPGLMPKCSILERYFSPR